jgi:hypothetical protein
VYATFSSCSRPRASGQHGA